MGFDVSELFFTLAALGVPVLAVAGIGCLLFCGGEANYKHLVRTAAVFLGTGALSVAGGALLNCFGLAWWTAPLAVFFGVLLLSGWVGITFTVACLLPMELPKWPAVLRRAVKGAVLFFAVLVILVSLWLGPLLLMFACGNTERVVNYQGQTLLEVDDGFLDPHYSYYVYHGPLVRGTERVYDEYEPLH